MLKNMKNLRLKILIGLLVIVLLVIVYNFRNFIITKYNDDSNFCLTKYDCVGGVCGESVNKFYNPGIDSGNCLYPAVVVEKEIRCIKNQCR